MLRILLVLTAIAATSMASVMWLVGPGQRSRPRVNLARVLASRSGERPVPPPRGEVHEPHIPLFSEDWTEDSGQMLSMRYVLPIDNPSSLAQVRAADEGRSQRGIAKLLEELGRIDRTTLAGRAHTVQLDVFLGMLHMSIGEFTDADRYFADAQLTDPNCPLLLRANIEAIRGVAALRRGETENCVDLCTRSSCIFPLNVEARHSRTSGSRDAIRHFTSYLEHRPEDLGVRWLLNVAYMTLGEYPEKVPPSSLIPLGPYTSDSGVGRLENVAGRVGLNARGSNMAGGAIVDDFDSDGLPDVFTSSKDPTQGCSLFVNRGDGTFVDRSSQAGLDEQIGALNCNHADYDNDGDLDILLLRGGWENARRPSLLRNEGNGTFTDVTVAARLCDPIGTQTGAWADFDRDGRLDLYLGGEYKPRDPDSRNRGRLYRNNGDGTFTDLADSAGVRNDRFAKGVAWGDYDNDGYPDLYVSNLHQANRLYRNNHDGTFTDVAALMGVTEPVASFSCWFWDYDNDGREDIFVTGSKATLPEIILSQLGRQAGGERPRLYRNEGDRFVDVTKDVGLDRVWLPMGSNFGDIDNDGFLDFYLGTGSPPYSYLVPNVLMHNVSGGRFEDITIATGTGHLQKGHGISFADWDLDGDVDLFLESGGTVPGDRAHNLLFENPGHGNRWTRIRLIGTRSNRAAIGARLRLDMKTPEGRRSIYRTIGGGSSFGNNPLAPTIGLGEAQSFDTIEIRWPVEGQLQVSRDLPLDCTIEIREGVPGFRTLGERVRNRADTTKISAISRP